MMDVNCREKSWHRHIWENYHDLTRSHCKYISCEASHSWWTIHVETWNSSTSGTFGGAVGVPFIDTKITTTRWWFQLYLEFSPLHYMGKDPVWLAYSSNSLNKKQQLELDNKLLESAFFFLQNVTAWWLTLTVVIMRPTPLQPSAIVFWFQKKKRFIHHTSDVDIPNRVRGSFPSHLLWWQVMSLYPWSLTARPWRKGSWKTILSYWGPGTFQGRHVKLWGGGWLTFDGSILSFFCLPNVLLIWQDFQATDLFLSWSSFLRCFFTDSTNHKSPSCTTIWELIFVGTFS